MLGSCDRAYLLLTLDHRAAINGELLAQVVDFFDVFVLLVGFCSAQLLEIVG